MNGPAGLVRPVALGATLAALGLLGVFVWALGVRLDDWEARSFVLLFYGALVAALLGTLSLFVQRRAGAAVSRTLTVLLSIAWMGWLIGALWAWAPVTRVWVAYVLRQFSMLCLR